MKSVHWGRLAVVVACTTLTSRAVVRYVDLNSTNATPPFTNWASAAVTIQAAVDAADSGDEILVTNGVYQSGGRAVVGTMTNRVVVDKPLTVRSVNGSQFTIIQGYQVPGLTNGDEALRCVYLTNGASLIGFTLMNGATRWVVEPWPYSQSGGGGAWCENDVMISNCVMSANSALRLGGGVFRGTLNNCRLEGNVSGGDGGGAGGGAGNATLYKCTLAGNRASVGGGAYGCSLYNCILINNSASNFGGGGSACGFNNCTVTGNSAATGGGGGAAESGLSNSIVYYNSATSGEPNSAACRGDNSCATGDLPPYYGVRNITNPPLFAANLHLRSDSPCINAGNNASAAGPTDFDGNPRIAGGTVDIGAYEFQTPASAISYAWLQQYGLAIYSAVDYQDPDGDGMNNWQEWRADTVPINASSALRVLSSTGNVSGVSVSWQSVSTRSYWVERATNLAVQPAFSTIATNLPGQAGTKTYTDSTAVGPGPFFYRVGVQP
jgi:hypothetical protein